MKNFTVANETNLRQFTDDNYPQGSFYFSRLLKTKDIRVNGDKVGSNISLKTGDIVQYYTSKQQEEKEFFRIRYEDENVLILDKYDGVNSEAMFAHLSSLGEYYFIHRLDRNTKGLMIFGKSSLVASELLNAFKQKQVFKYYDALCFGRFPKLHYCLQAYLKKDSTNALVQISETPNGGEKIMTEYWVLKKYRDYTKVRILLHTGKTHQIRAHLAFIGCPVVGDEKYGIPERNKKLNVTRQCLIAKKLEFHFDGMLSYLNDKIFESSFSFPCEENNSLQ